MHPDKFSTLIGLSIVTILVTNLNTTKIILGDTI